MYANMHGIFLVVYVFVAGVYYTYYPYFELIFPSKLFSHYKITNVFRSIIGYE